MSTVTFRAPTCLPCFVGGERRMDIWADGYRLHRQIYDGTRNQVEITPMVAPPGLICPIVEVGQSYTISSRELHRRIFEDSMNINPKGSREPLPSPQPEPFR